MTEDDKVEGVREDYTECWPKVLFFFFKEAYEYPNITCSVMVLQGLRGILKD